MRRPERRPSTASGSSSRAGRSSFHLDYGGRTEARRVGLRDGMVDNPVGRVFNRCGTRLRRVRELQELQRRGESGDGGAKGKTE